MVFCIGSYQRNMAHRRHYFLSFLCEVEIASTHWKFIHAIQVLQCSGQNLISCQMLNNESRYWLEVLSLKSFIYLLTHSSRTCWQWCSLYNFKVVAAMLESCRMWKKLDLCNTVLLQCYDETFYTLIFCSGTAENIQFRTAASPRKQWLVAHVQTFYSSSSHAHPIYMTNSVFCWKLFPSLGQVFSSMFYTFTDFFMWVMWAWAAELQRLLFHFLKNRSFNEPTKGNLVSCGKT